MPDKRGFRELQVRGGSSYDMDQSGPRVGAALLFLACVLAASACADRAASGQDGGLPPDAICPEITNRLYQPQRMDSVQGTNCGQHCRQVTFAANVWSYDVWGDYVAYLGGADFTASHLHVYVANVVTGEEWLVERPMPNPDLSNCTGVAIAQGKVALVNKFRYYPDSPSSDLTLAQLFRTLDLNDHSYSDVACMKYEYEVGAAFFEMAGTSLYYAICLPGTSPSFACGDLFEFDLITLQELPVVTDGTGLGEIEVSGDWLVWTSEERLDSDIIMYDLVSQEATYVTREPGDQWAARVSGRTIVWADHRNDPGGWRGEPRNSDIYYFDLDTGQSNEVTVQPARQDSPDIGGDFVVWVDWRNNPNPVPQHPAEFENSDIYLKVLSTGDEFQLTDFPATEREPTIQADLVFVEMEDDRGVNSVFALDFQSLIVR